MDIDDTNELPKLTLWLLIDGYNVVAPTAPPRNPGAHWLHQERMQLVTRLSQHLDSETKHRTCVVFDAADPPPDRSHRFQTDGIDIIFAVEYPEADDLLEELIAAHSVPKSLAVVSSDQRVQTAARRRGCKTFESQTWLDELMDGHPGLAVDRSISQPPGDPLDDKPEVPDKGDVADWLKEFGYDD